ncbi:MAG: phenylalanine--tRNA ligase subunit beta [Candidatus Nanohaloarchaea archaeon]|nr:phenylalanine--tRNA ligase subunit beta [Candidatus Nanohaloarchaea archaeon]
MAVIEISHPHLEELVGTELSVEELEDEGSMMGVLFEDGEEDKLEVEVEPNRPDLLSVEGIARALRGFLEVETGAVDYPVEDGEFTVEVDGSVTNVRRHIACAVVSDLDLGEGALNSIIQLQEKLTETYGRKREKIAIGLHDAAPLESPVTYEAVDPDGVAFIPLGRDEEMTPAEILAEHEKGQQYGWILEDADRYPVLRDADGTVLSMPPVINGVATEVTEDTGELFLDVTGTSRQEVETALTILCAALHERGGTIESVDVDGERLPDMEPDLMTVDPEYVRDVSGLHDLSDSGIAEQLESMRYDASVDGGELVVEVPAYRADVMHAYDVIEDAVIGYGYRNVDEELPEVATVGGRSDERVFIDALRDIMVGAGAQECMTFILSTPAKLFDRMERDREDIVTMANPLTEDYTAVRNWLLPSLMQVLEDNQHNRYPQRLFEVGTCSRLSDESHTGAEDVQKLAYATAHRDAGFSEARGVLQTVAKRLGVELAVEEADHGSFADGRCGTVLVDGEDAGVIGEVSEQVRENWDVEMPVAAFEIDVETLQDAAT